MWRVFTSIWVLALTAVVTGESSPPVITNFLSKDLLNPEEVKFNTAEAFRLPCNANGSNLKWTWKHNGKEIQAYNGRPYTLLEDGTLIGNYLLPTDSGTYQCFVKDENTGAAAFSRKLKVAVTVVGKFISPKDEVVNVTLGEPFVYDCPPHEYSYGVVFSWGNSDSNGRHTFARNDRRSISSSGTLFITSLTQEDINEIESYKGIRCIITGANSFQESGTLRLKRIGKVQTDSENSTLPSWSATPKAEETAVEGRNTSLYCFASGRPSPEIAWKKNGQTIGNNENSFIISRSFFGRLLFIQNVDKEEHEGTYTCEAVNVLNEESPLSFSTYLKVEVPPKWNPLPPPKKINIVIEYNKTLECNVDADPAPNVTWYKDGRPLESSKNHKLDGHKLHLIDVTLDEVGMYQCEAVNTHGMIISFTSVSVLAWKPSFDDVQFGPFNVLNKKEARLPCQPSAAPRPSFQWYREGDLLTYDENNRYKLEEDGTLVIKEVDNSQDAANYTCRAVNFKGTDSVSALLNVQVPPQLTTIPEDQEAIEGEIATLHCTATGNPTPKITWSKDGEPLGDGETLRLEALRNHTGKYWCTAENGLNVTVNASATLNILFPPSLTRKPSDKTIMENEEVAFYCAAIGNPVPQIVWMKNGNVEGFEETLSFEAKRSHSGEYWCSASNGLGEAVNASADLDVQFSPSLIARPDDKIIIEGATVTFHCNATGNPAPNMTWTKDGKTITTGETLSFVTDRNQSGQYWCSADNGLNATVNASATLDVQFPPSFTSKPSNQTVMENANVTLHCTAIGNPQPGIRWTKDGKTLGSGETLSLEARRDQSGKYWCSANNGLSKSVNDSAYLVIQFAPSLITKPMDHTVIESAIVTFHCNANGNPVPSITWTKDGKAVGQGNKLSFATNRNQSGEYWCSADNGLNTIANASATLDVQYSPSLTTQPSNQTVIENQQVAFYCSAIGNPVPNITWMKDQKVVGNGQELTFGAIRDDSGQYWCIAENGLNATVTAAAYLNVQYTPRLTLRPSDTTITEGNNATFHCIATGNPTPQITWTKDGKAVSTGETLSFVTDRNQSGEYWCLAENGLNLTVNASAILDVQFQPSLLILPTSQTILEGAIATFHCNATGNPTPEVAWLKDGKIVGSGETLSYEANRSDSGQYWCLADNGLSSAVNASVNLDVQYPPSLTTKPSNQTVIENEQISFRCSAIGSPVPKITWIKDGKTLGTEQTLSFGAQRNHSGRYWCSADNGLSEAVNASADLDVQYAPSLLTVPTNQTIIEADDATFQCTATGNPTPEITWTKDGRIVGTGETLNFEASRNQSGMYWCSADNGIDSTVNASAYLNVLYLPSLVSKAVNQTVNETDHVTFHCSATGNPVPQITWFKDGTTVHTGSELSFTALRNHSGKYWCLANNGLNATVNSLAYLNVQYPPSFTKEPANQTMIEFEETTLHCTATGNPMPKIKWVKDGKTVGTGISLILKTSRNETGEYWCWADNGLGKSIKAGSYLDVQFQPSFTTTPSNLTVAEKTQSVFTCYATGNPAPSITWIQDEEIVGIGDTLSLETQRNQSGEYRCSADNGVGLAINASAYLDVQFAPTLTETPSKQTITEGSEVTFHCTASGNPVPGIKWIKDDTVVGEGETLTFDALRNQSGKYWCIADNGLNDTANASAYLDVQFPPSFTITPSDQTVTEKDQIRFSCTATGNPVPNITWIKDEKTVGTGETLSFEASRNRSGVYWCSADNRIDKSINTSVSLDVQYSASLDMHPTNQTVIEGAVATFYCNATGKPTPKIRWIKDGKTVGEEDTLSFVTKRNDSGRFWCLADNGFNATVKAMAYLNVKFPPSFTSTPSNQTVTEKEQSTFTCTVTGNPAPNITWTKDGKTVGTGDTMTLETHRNQSGEYWCSAENGVGLAINASAYLDVQFAPTLTEIPNKQTITEGVGVTFHCTASGNPVPQIKWTKDDTVVGEGEILTFDALRNRSGEYWCIADNGLNDTANASAYLDVQFPPSFTITPSDQTVTEKDQITLNCTAIGNPVPNITWIKDGKTVAKGETLSFEARRNHSGVYWCSADNRIHNSINTSVSLDVQYSASLDMQPTNQTVIEGIMAIFHCNATGNPTPKIRWIKDGKNVGEEDTLSFVTKRNDSGRYWCLADNGFNATVKAIAYLNVQFPPSFTSTPSIQTVTEKEQATFTCTAAGNPAPNITWTKDGKTVGTGDTLSLETHRNQSGEYLCSAENGVGLAITASTYLDVQFAPTLNETPSKQTITEDSKVTFHCTASGNPLPEIKWIKDDTVVGEGKTLTFDALRNRSGEYWCIADNGLNDTANASAYLDVQFPPSFTITPSDLTVTEKDQITLNCTAIGNPVPNITWSKDGKTVGKGDTLSFEASRNHSGKYWCSADNGIDKSINASVSLDVQYSASLDMQPNNQTVIEGAIVTFHCNATGNPTPEIRWIKDGKTVGEEDTLSISTKRNDSGRYWCLADNGFNATVKAIAYLNVKFPPSITSTPSNQTVTEKEQIKFTCNAAGNPAPNITWTKDGKTVGTGDTLSLETHRNQSGEYWCSAENGVGLAINASTYLDVQFAPTLTKTPSKQTITEDSKVTFHCTASGNPVPEIKWIKDDTAVDEGETLTFDAIRNRSGEYWCIADNGLNDTANASAYLDVQFPPSFTITPSDLTVTEKDQITLNCTAIGNPVPNITWSKDGKTVGKGETLSFEASRNHSGKYWCSADNGIDKSINASVSLDVQYSASLDMQPTNQTVIEGAMATFHCNATGNPTPKIRWIKDGKTVGEEDTLSISTKRNDSGRYWCSADNGFNATVKAIAYLNVKFPPSFTSTPSNQTVTEKEQIKFTCNAAGNPVPNITWTKDGKTVGTGDTLSLETHRNQSGEYWCSAENGVGLAINASAFLDVRFAPILTETPSKQTITEGSEVTFHCTASGNPVPEIKWIKDDTVVGEGETLTFDALRNRSGEYWCIADNGLNDTVNVSAYLDVHFPPSFTITPSDLTVTEKDQITFNCTATGNPAPNITWFKDGKTVATGETLSFEARRNNSGKYWCSADNGVDKSINTSVSLDVQYSASLDMQPTNQTVIEGAMATFHCNATGNPTPKIRWIKDGKTVGEEDTLSLVTKRNDSGRYWCLANNGFNATVKAIAYLNVKFPLSFTSTPSNQTVTENEQTTFACTAAGNPVPHITWTKDGKTVGTGDTLSLETHRNQSGEYWCSAENGVGLAIRASAYLDVQFAPTLTETPSKQTITEGSKVTFHCTPSGNPVPEIKWIKDDTVVGEGETLTFDALRNRSGKYWCIADNGLNETANANAYLDVQFPPSFIGTPSDQTVTEKDQITFTCNATGNPEPNITWIKDGKTVGTGETLSLEASRNHSGIYWCSADNGIGKRINISASLDVQYSASLDMQPTNQTVIEGAMATFHCNATGNPTPKIRWIKDGKTVGEEDTLSFVTKRNDSGRYWCLADNGLNATVKAIAYLNVQFPPRFTSTPSNQTVTEKEQTTFTCTAAGNPAPNITWTKDGKTVSTGDTLSLETHRNQSGEYLCSAENGVELAINASAFLDVQFAPTLTETPSKQTITEGSKVTFHCTASGNPVPEMKWIKDDIVVGEGETLTFDAVRNRSGKYWCIADNGLNETANANAYLDVQFPPSFIGTPSDQTVTEKDQITFTCNATGNPEPNITWIKDGKTVGTGETLSLEASRNHSGIYWCSADNGIGKRINISASLDVQYSASLDMQPTNQTVIKGAMATFHCNATGNPTPKIRWIKDGKTVGEEDTLSFVTKRNDSGRYWCLADNGLNATVKAIAYLNVQFPPSFTSTPSNQTVTEKEQTTFTCTAGGKPAPNITWTKDGKTVGTGDTLTLETHRNQSGEYLCSAENGVGLAIRASAFLDVQFTPTLTETPSKQTITEDSKATFHCTASGNPVPEIKWIKDDTVVGEGETLTFDAVRNRSGEYWCIADNGLIGTANASAYLDVQFPPSFTITPSDQTVTEKDQITFTCNATGNPVPSITWTKDGKTVATGEKLSFEARRNHSGKYWCSADNGIGKTINTSVSFDVQYSASLDMQPTNQTVIEGAMATFHCNATGNPTPKIRWIKDGKTMGEEDALSFVTKRNDSGRYWCLADNGFNATVKGIAYLNVQFPPSFSRTPIDQTVREGEQITFHCTATGNPTPNITWTKDGKTVATEEILSLEAKRNDSGEYWCFAQNGIDANITTSVSLDVQFSPDVTIQTSYQTVIEGNVATIHCSAIGNPTPKISWIKDGMTVGTGNTLSFRAHRSQSGDYWCSAENGLNRTANASSYLDVHFKPEKTKLSVNADVTKPIKFGSSIKFNCTTFSHPDADGYKFYRDQELLVSNISGIYHLRLQRSGVYSCVPFNSAGDGKRAVLRIEVNAWKPSFELVSFGPFYLFKGIQARLPCKPLAEPYPTFRWFKDGVAIEYGKNESYMMDTDGSLIILKVGAGDSGKYTCEAQNYLGKTNATADCILLERTQIVVKPQNRTVVKGTNLDLPCMATGDPSLELSYIWKRDGVDITDITDDSNIQWLEGQKVLQLSDVSFEDAGVYTCIAFTPQPRESEDRASAIVSIEGVPSPPTDLQITDCHNRRTNLSWTPVASDDAHVIHYLIEQQTNHDPFVFKLVDNVTSTSLSLDLPGWSTLRFRIRAVNNVGPSRPSIATPEGICTTPVGVPQKYPMNLRGTPKKANELSITWTPMSAAEWNAPGCYYVLKYRKVNLGFPNEWMVQKIGDPRVHVFPVTDAGYYHLWEFKIRVGNHEGLGPESPVQRSFSGQNAPAVKPESTEVGAVTASSVALAWEPVTLPRGSVDGYKIYYWGKSRSVSSRRRRQAIPSDADVITVMGGKTQQATLTGLKPYTNYQVVVKAFNAGGEGPASAVIVIETLEGEPGPPSDVQIDAFGEFISVTWKEPKEPNGIITNYQLGSAEYNGSLPEIVPVAMETVGPNVFKKLLGNKKFEKSYVVEVRAQTSKGWGKSARTTTRTIKTSAPAKPEKPTVVASGKDAMSVIYHFAVGGGWTHEFKVLYRKKEGGGEFQETAWVDHFSTQQTEVTNLEPEVYEFKTIGKNRVGQSPESDVTEGRPEQEPVVSGQRGEAPVYSSDWFISLIILSACALLVIVIVLLYRRWKRRRSSNFKVTEHEKETGQEEIEQCDPIDVKRRAQWKKTLQDRLEEESQDSLDEYGGEAAYFAEDGSFIGDLEQGRRDSVYDEIPDRVV